ncbi:unnamed protein product, partial [Symbiodinium microadriaticum]
MSSDWLKVCKVYNAVVNVEEMIVLWIHRRIALHPVESDEPRADGGNPPIPEMDFRGGIPRLAMMCARDVNDLMKFVEVAEGETSEEDDVRMMKASPENIYTPNIEDIVSKVSPESPLKVTHTVDPREVLPVVDVWVPAMEAELAALDKMAAIKRCKGLEPGKIRRKVRCVACGNLSGESAEELGDVYSAGATIDLVRICLAEKNAHKGVRNGGQSTGNVTTASARWRSPNGGEMRIVPCVTDENLHKLVEIDSSGKESIVGYILFYVDDTLAVGPPEYLHGFFDWLEATWETSGREVVSKIAKKILCYYNAAKDAAFVIEPQQEAKLVLYTDASHSPAGTKSISGSLVLWKGVAICWRAANQSLTALSSAEAELIALSEGAQLLRSVKTTLEDMGIHPEMCELRVDATAAIAVASSGGSWRTRHLRLREHWLSELVNSDEYQLVHQPGLHQLADGLTKQLTSERVWKLMEAWNFFKGNSSEMKKVTIN